MYEVSHDLLNNLRLRILGNYEISRTFLKCLDSVAGTQTATPKIDFYIYAKNREKSAVKYSTEKKHVLLNFVNLSTIVCPRFSEEKHFHL